MKQHVRLIVGFFTACLSTMGCTAEQQGEETSSVESALRAKPPSTSQDLGCLSTTNNYDNLRNVTLTKGTVTYTFSVCSIPADRTRLLAYVQTYWNKNPTVVLIDPDGGRHPADNVITDPNQSNTFWVNVPAELGQYALEVSNASGSYTAFVAALMTSQSGFGAP